MSSYRRMYPLVGPRSTVEPTHFPADLSTLITAVVTDGRKPSDWSPGEKSWMATCTPFEDASGSPISSTASLVAGEQTVRLHARTSAAEPVTARGPSSSATALAVFVALSLSILPAGACGVPNLDSLATTIESVGNSKPFAFANDTAAKRAAW